MSDLKEAIEIYNKRVEQNPQYSQEVVDEWRENMPEQFIDYIYRTEYGCHIVNDELYDKAISYLKWADGKGTGAKWSLETIKTN